MIYSNEYINLEPADTNEIRNVFGFLYHVECNTKGQSTLTIVKGVNISWSWRAKVGIMGTKCDVEK